MGKKGSSENLMKVFRKCSSGKSEKKNSISLPVAIKADCKDYKGEWCSVTGIELLFPACMVVTTLW